MYMCMNKCIFKSAKTVKIWKINKLFWSVNIQTVFILFSGVTLLGIDIQKSTVKYMQNNVLILLKNSMVTVRC